MLEDNNRTLGVDVEANRSSISTSNHSQDDESQAHGDAYGKPSDLSHPENNDESPLVDSHGNPDGPVSYSSVDGSNSQGNIGSREALSRLLTIDLLITLVVVGSIALVIKVYRHQSNLTKVQKNVFNTVITGLIVVLGLSFFEAFKSFAKGYGVWVLSIGEHHWEPKQRQYIDASDSLRNVFKLGVSSLRTWTAVLCFAWVFLNLLAQISVALVSLTYSIDDGTNWNDTYRSHGTVHASNLTCYIDYFGANGPCRSGSDGTGQQLAHAFGDMALATRCCNYTALDSVLTSKNDCPYYCNRSRNRQQFAYRFNEYNLNDTTKAYPYFTDRVITASSGKCFDYSLDGKPEKLKDGYLLYKFHNDTFNDSMKIPAQSGTWAGTTYVYRGSRPPPTADGQSCGPRCMNVWAHRAPHTRSDEKFFSCPITISNVTNAADGNQAISQGLARLAATSIALQGRMDNDKGWNQYQLYAVDSFWETGEDEPDQVGAKMAEFAMGSIATMARSNPLIEASGTVPHLGSRISVHWNYLVALLVGIATVHLLLVIGSAYLHSKNDGRTQGSGNSMGTELTDYHTTQGVIA